MVGLTYKEVIIKQMFRLLSESYLKKEGAIRRSFRYYFVFGLKLVVDVKTKVHSFSIS